MISKITFFWLPKPQDHDYLSAKSYLSLLFDKKATSKLIDRLRKSDMTEFQAKDIFRASGLPLLGINNSHVLKDKKKITAKMKLSPILLVRDTSRGRVIIADGYHRMCAVYYFDEDAVIPCKII